MPKFPKVEKFKYSDIRPKLRSGDLWICSGKYPFSEMIKLATNSNWSHVAVIMRVDSLDRVMVMESVEDIGVRAVPTSQYLDNYEVSGKPYKGRIFVARHKRMPRAKSQAKQLAKFAVDQLGLPYDKAEIMGIAYRVLLASRDLPVPPRSPKKSPAYICSEYVWECLNSVGITIAYNKNGFVTTEDIVSDPDVHFIGEIVGK